MMATAPGSGTESNETECPVCHEEFKVPKLLPCGHLLCRNCLVQWLNSSFKADCPLCRCTIVEPEKQSQGKSSEEVADALPSDLVLTVLTESQQLLNSQQKCTTCMTEHEELSLCIDCNDLFCLPCATCHNKLAIARHHKLQQLSTMTAKELADSRTSFCLQHRNQITSVFCTSHQMAACTDCAFFEHRKCPGVVRIEIELGEKQSALREQASRLNAAEIEQEHAISRLDQHLNDHRKMVVAAAAEVQAVCDRLESAVTSCRNRLAEQVRDAGLHAEDSIKAGKICLENRRGKLTLHRRVIERAADCRNFDAVSGMMSSMETSVNDLDLSASLPADAKAIPSVSLAIDHEAVSLLVRALGKLGHLSITQAAGVVDVKSPVFSFHHRHGECITLSTDQQTAERTSRIGHGIVLSCEPMLTHMLYEVRVDKTVSDWQFSRIWLGVVTELPDMVHLPDWSGDLRRGVVLHHDWVRFDDGAEVKSSVGWKLREVKEGNKVGLALDGNRNLHLYIDGVPEDKSVATRVADPCFFMVDVHACWKKVTAMPVKAVSELE